MNMAGGPCTVKSKLNKFEYVRGQGTGSDLYRGGEGVVLYGEVNASPVTVTSDLPVDRQTRPKRYPPTTSLAEETACVSLEAGFDLLCCFVSR